MLETVADVVEQVVSAQAHGFDLATAQVEKEVQGAIKRLAAASHWIKAEIELGPTVAEEPNYVLPDKVVRLFDLMVGENEPYARRDILILWDLRAGRVGLPGDTRGVYAERFSEDGKIKSFDLFPTPEEAGQPIKGLASITPDDLLPGDSLPFPQQHRGAVLDFTIAGCYEKSDEEKAMGESYEKRALGTAESLYLLANARTGSGPWRIPVAGHRRR